MDAPRRSKISRAARAAARALRRAARWRKARNTHETGGDALLMHALRAARVIAWECDLATGRLTHREDVQVFGARPLPATLGYRRALAMVHPEDRDAVLRRLRAAIERPEPFIHHFRLMLRGASNPLWVEQHGCVVCDAQNRAIGLRGAVIDISAHKQALDALAVADRRKDDFLATLAHEIRNPLSAIGTAAQVLRSAALDPKQAGACIDMIRRQAAHLGRLVDDLLDISRVIRDRLDLKRERLDLRSAVSAALEAASSDINARKQRIEVSLPPEPVYVEGDAVRLAQVFGNLLSNAAKYTPQGGEIRVAAERNGRWAIVRVRDSGIGIAPEHLPHVFEPFYQVDSSLAHAQGGLGIGLALVRRIAEFHGGSAEVHSEGRGTGSEFTVRLPLDGKPRPSEPAHLLGAASLNLSASPALRVLIADDNSDVAEAMALALRAWGHHVSVALDGEEALRIADDTHPHVALLDLGMPKREGHEVAREIRHRPWAAEQETVLVALTGWNPANLHERIDLSAFDAQIVKPTDVDVVSRLIQSVQQRTPGRAM